LGITGNHPADKALRPSVFPQPANPGLVLHADNGSPMKGSALLDMLHKLGVVTS